jgi:hypothetical protein
MTRGTRRCRAVLDETGAQQEPGCRMALLHRSAYK